MDRKHIKKELNKLGLNPESIPEKDGFKVPDGYFDKMQQRVMDELGLQSVEPDARTEKPVRTTKIRSLRILNPSLAWAAIGLLAIIGTAAWFYGQHNHPSSLAFEEPSGEEALEYLIQNVEEFETQLLVELSDEDYVTSQLEQTSEDAIDQILDEYLLEANDDEIMRLLEEEI